MNNRLFKLYGVLGMAGVCLLLATGANAAKLGKVDICHAPPGNPENIKHKRIGSKALTAHLNHGDWLVTSAKCDAIADNNCDGVPDAPASDDADCVAQNSEGYTCEAGACLPPPEPPLTGKCRGWLQEVVVIWDGADSVDLTPGSGVSLSASQVDPGDVLTIFPDGSTNDVFVSITGSAVGDSKFHISCSDRDMNADNDDQAQDQLPGESQDCGKFQGDAKSNESFFINTWLLEGMLDADGRRLVCDFDPTT